MKLLRWPLYFILIFLLVIDCVSPSLLAMNKEESPKRTNLQKFTKEEKGKVRVKEESTSTPALNKSGDTGFTIDDIGTVSGVESELSCIDVVISYDEGMLEGVRSYLDEYEVSWEEAVDRFRQEEIEFRPEGSFGEEASIDMSGVKPNSRESFKADFDDRVLVNVKAGNTITSLNLSGSHLKNTGVLADIGQRYKGCFERMYLKSTDFLEIDCLKINCDTRSVFIDNEYYVYVNGNPIRVVNSVLVFDPATFYKKIDKAGKNDEAAYAIVFRLVDGRFLIREVSSLNAEWDKKVSSLNIKCDEEDKAYCFLLETGAKYRVKSIYTDPFSQDSDWEKSLKRCQRQCFSNEKEEVRIEIVSKGCSLRPGKDYKKKRGSRSIKGDKKGGALNKRVRMIETLADLCAPNPRVIIDIGVISGEQFRKPYGFFYQFLNIRRSEDSLKHDDRLDAVYMALHFLNLDMPLRELNCSGCRFESLRAGLITENLNKLFKGYVRFLEKLDMSDAGVTNPHVETIAQLTKLKDLKLSRNPKVSEIGLKHLMKLSKNLERLDISNIGLVEGSIMFLTVLSSLRELDLSGNSIDVDGLISWVLAASRKGMRLKRVGLRIVVESEEEEIIAAVLAKILDGEVHFAGGVRSIKGSFNSRGSDSRFRRSDLADVSGGAYFRNCSVLNFLIESSSRSSQTDARPGEGSSTDNESPVMIVPEALANDEDFALTHLERENDLEGEGVVTVPTLTEDNLLDVLPDLFSRNPGLSRVLCFLTAAYLNRQPSRS